MKIKALGFTLMELMIGVVIVGILTKIAVESYQSYMVKSTRAAAQSSLMDIAQRQQQYLLDTRAYASSVTALNTSVPTSVSTYYTVSVSASSGPPPAFTITATPVDSTRQVSDGALTIDQAGSKTPAAKW